MAPGRRVPPSSAASMRGLSPPKPRELPGGPGGSPDAPGGHRASGLGRAGADRPSPRLARVHKPHLRPRQSAPDRGEPAHRPLLLAFAAALSPRWLVIENVVHMQGWNGYTPLLSALQEMGYRLRIEVLDSARFGVPRHAAGCSSWGIAEAIPDAYPSIGAGL